MTFADLKYTVLDHVATIRIDRPSRMNTITSTTTEELIAAFHMADADDQVRVVVLTGTGDAFCAGVELQGDSGFFDYESKRAQFSHRTVEGVEAPRDGAGILTLTMFQCRKPIVAAVNGVAAGVGATMILAADVRIAARDARFGFVFARRGIVPEGASTWFLPRLVGISVAARWLYTGAVVDAETALKEGLVSEVHDREDFDDAVVSVAQTFASTAPVAVAVTRQMLWHGLGSDHPMSAHRAESRALYALGGQSDAREGVQAFLDKRSPNFCGRVSIDLPDVFPNDPPVSYF